MGTCRYPPRQRFASKFLMCRPPRTLVTSGLSALRPRLRMRNRLTRNDAVEAVRRDHRRGEGKPLAQRSHGESMAPAAQGFPQHPIPWPEGSTDTCSGGAAAEFSGCVSTAVLRDRGPLAPMRFHTDPDNFITETGLGMGPRNAVLSGASCAGILGNLRKAAGNGAAMPMGEVCLNANSDEKRSIAKMKNVGIYKALVDQLDRLARHNRQGSFRTKERYYEAFKRFCAFLADEYRLQKLSNISGRHLVSYILYMQEHQSL